MDTKPKIIANYLPQYHRIPENDKWWGEGFTDWISVKNAVPLFENHVQPKVPKDGNYYSLDNAETIRWQADLARSYGVYGFGIYHYWFNSQLHLLEKPAEILLDNKDIDIHYLFLWDNCTWKRTWSNIKRANDWAPKFDSDDVTSESGILAELKYGDEKDWKIHFDYLLPFFKDERYIKIDNKPLFAFFQSRNDFKTICAMTDYWDTLAKKAGFSGIICMMRDNCFHMGRNYKIRYTPFIPVTKLSFIQNRIMNYLAEKKHAIRFRSYDNCWNEILRDAKKADSKTFLSGFVGFDDTPRRGNKGRIITDATPEKFEHYLKELIDISQKQNKEYVFITAWNEWGEGAYLEPDEQNGFAYLEALKKAVEE